MMTPTDIVIGRPRGYQLASIESTHRWMYFGHASRKAAPSMGKWTPLTDNFNQNYVAQRWHEFLIYIGLTLGAFVINAFMNSILPMIYRGACMYIRSFIRSSRLT
jgi:hypothetical protein